MENTKGMTVNENKNLPLSATEIKTQVGLIQQVMKSVMIDGQHYGTIAGCGKKKILFKSGAEKLALTFKLRPVMENTGDITITELANGHRDYNIFCRIITSNGVELSTGVGSCSTMESKYRYRNASDYEITDEKIPADAKEKKAEYRKQGFGMKNIDGSWKWVKYKSGEKVENPDIADVYNTVLKMAKKRAFIDGILSATGASDIFTQDEEDMPKENVTKPQEKKEKPSTPKPINEGAQKITGVNKSFHEVKKGKKTCAIMIGDTYYNCNIANVDIVEIMRASVGQEVEIEYTESPFKGTMYRYISDIVTINSLD